MTEFQQAPLDPSRTELEHELSSYACLHISAMQLASARDPGSLLQHVAELLDQLVGASRFELRSVSPDGQRMELLVGRGNRRPSSSAVEEGVVRDAIAHGRVVMAPVLDGRVQPLAAVPLCCSGEVVAVLSIDALHGHKSAWAAADSQLFDVLSAVGGVTLVACSASHGGATPRARVEQLARRLQGSAGDAAASGAEEL